MRRPNFSMSMTTHMVAFIATVALSAIPFLAAGPSDVVYPCYHGTTAADGRCECDAHYAGRMCERRMHCRGHQRHRNFTCLLCESGWTGTFCDLIECGAHGRRAETDKARCECAPPYSGRHCAELRRADVYAYYNARVVYVSAWGALALIPLAALAFSCRRCERRLAAAAGRTPPLLALSQNL